MLTAAPGAGKTTRVPPALAADGPVIVLQPRRVAARSIARRIAAERGWTLGREVGWHVRFEQQFGPDTRVLLATEGILTARLQQDPLLSGFRTVILDEFHERSIHADLGLALVRQAWLARDDLRIVVMSATMDADAVAGYLDGCPVIAVASRPHPLEIDYTPQLGVAGGVERALARTDGHVLGFLAGAAEIRRAAAEVAPIAAAYSADVVTLHGGLSADEQDEALKEVARRRVILATNIAETSLTVPGVRAVVDTGLHKVARYDPARAIDSLEVERIPQDSADQRAGRAGRVAAGAVWRLWRAADRLRPSAQAEIHRIDLAAVVLAVLSWGGDPYNLAWFEPPARYSLDAAFELLRGLGAVSGTRITAMGASMQRLPIHPRLGADPAGRRGRRRSGAGVRRALRAPLRKRCQPSHVERSADDRRQPGGSARSHHSRRPAALVAGGRAALQPRRAQLSARAVCRIPGPRGAPACCGIAEGAARVGPRRLRRSRERRPGRGVPDRDRRHGLADGGRLGGPHSHGGDRRSGVAEANRRAAGACVRRRFGDRSRDGARVRRCRRALRADRPAGGGRGRVAARRHLCATPPGRRRSTAPAQAAVRWSRPRRPRPGAGRCIRQALARRHPDRRRAHAGSSGRSWSARRPRGCRCRAAVRRLSSTAKTARSSRR